MRSLINFENNDTILFNKSKVDKDNISINCIFTDLIKILEPYIVNNKISKEDRNSLQELFNLFNKLFNNTSTFRYRLKEHDDLEDIIKKILEFCPANTNLNWIGTNKVTDMSDVFNEIKFNGDISLWDTSNVKNMARMFRSSNFNGNIENWNTSKVEDMSFMFQNNKSFNGDLSKWNTSKVRSMSHMISGADMFDKETIKNWDYHRCHDIHLITGIYTLLS